MSSQSSGISHACKSPVFHEMLTSPYRQGVLVLCKRT